MDAGRGFAQSFPCRRKPDFRESFAYAGECTDRDYSVLVFPEGRHTTDGRINPFRAGIGLLANNLGLPIVPLRIDGLFELKRARKRFAWPGKIQVKVGAPLHFAKDADPEQITSTLQKTVKEL